MKVLRLLLVVPLLSGCALAELNQAPHLSPVGHGLQAEARAVPVERRSRYAPGYQSLWDERRDLFRDPRATRIGDPVTVMISMNDKAALDNKTDRSRDSQTKFGADYLADIFGWSSKGQRRRERQLTDFDQRGWKNRSDGGGQVLCRGGGNRRAAEWKFADQRIAGSAGELRDAHSDRCRHRQAARYRSEQHDRLRQDRGSADFIWWSRPADGGATTCVGAPAV